MKIVFFVLLNNFVELFFRTRLGAFSALASGFKDGFPIFRSFGALIKQGIIEGDQIQVAAFSLEYFSYLTGLTLSQRERKPNSVVRF